MQFLKYRLNTFIEGIENRITESYELISRRCDKDITLKNAISFPDVLMQTALGHSPQGVACRLFTVCDAYLELRNAINLTAIGVYKSSIDSIRRSLEIICVGLYFDEIDQEGKLSAFEWLESKTGTPYFTTVVIKKLFRQPKYSYFNGDDFQLEAETSSLFWDLSDYTHTRGISKSISSIQSKCGFGEAPKVNDVFLSEVLDLYLRTVKNVAILLAISNPLLLIGLPLEEKLGLGCHLGRFNKEQASILNSLVADEYKDKLMQILESDLSIQNEIHRITTMPDNEGYSEMLILLKRTTNSDH